MAPSRLEKLAGKVGCCLAIHFVICQAENSLISTASFSIQALAVLTRPVNTA